MTNATTQPLFDCYDRFDVAFDHGEGTRLYDAAGKEYLDFAAGIAVSAFGHAHPEMVAALTQQGAKLWHVSNMYRIPEQEQLAQQLVEASCADSVFFTNSGVEAIECAIKTARRFHSAEGRPEKYRVLCFHNAFHGRSLAAIAAAGKDSLTSGFGPVMPGFDQVPFLEMDAARQAITDETAAILVEAVQGEGGIVPARRDDLRALRQLCDEQGILLILDEIQCGMGRTGKLFAFEWAGITPDIIASAKGIGGGFPLGACLARAHVAQHMGPGSHGSTYGGNPLAMAVGKAAMDMLLAEGFMDAVCEQADYLRAGLLRLKSRFPEIIYDVRGMGLMLGVELDRPVKPLIAELIKHGLLVGRSGEHVMRLLPPLIVTQDDIDLALDRLGVLFETLPPVERENSETSL